MERNTGKPVVVYGSKYGSTKRYAQWIAERTGADIFEVSGFDPSRLSIYGTVLFGSPVYMGKIKYAGFIKRNWEVLRTRRVILFAVTGVPSGDPRRKKALEASLPARMRSEVLYYPLRGAFNYRGLTLFDKLLMSGPRLRFQIESLVKRNGRETPAPFSTPLDWTDKTAIEPIVDILSDGPHF